MNKLKSIIISSAISITLALILVEYGAKSIGFFSDKEFDGFKTCLMTNDSLRQKIGIITNIQRKLVGSEKETVGGIQKGKYRFEITTQKGVFCVEVEWNKVENDSTRVVRVGIVKD
jgi:hypothetical protein